jgi:hypothetical protein
VDELERAVKETSNIHWILLSASGFFGFLVAFILGDMGASSALEFGIAMVVVLQLYIILFVTEVANRWMYHVSWR